MTSVGMGRPLECIFCRRIAGSDKLAALPVCLHCKTTYEIIAQALGNQSMVLFVCKECGFRCDVPGVVKYESVNGTMQGTVEVDSTHNHCQNCGASSKPGKA